MKKLLILFLIIFSLLFIIFKNAISQEGNPFPIVKAIVYIPFSDYGFSSYSEGKYITNAPYSGERLELYMYNKGYDLKEQLGSGYFFKDKEGKSITITGKMYSRFFRVFYIPLK
ncbi:MAG: hypothetical protein WC850_06325 [Candidatus Gracilibacteria bacterium]